MRPLLLSNCKRNVHPSLIRGAPSRHIANITREYLAKRSIRGPPITGNCVRRVFAKQEEESIATREAQELKLISPIPQHWEQPTIRRLDYIPAVRREGVAVRVLEPSGSPLLIRKILLGPAVEELGPGSPLPIRKVSLGPVIRREYPRPDRSLDPVLRRTYHRPDQRPSAFGGSVLVRRIVGADEEIDPMTAPGHYVNWGENEGGSEAVSQTVSGRALPLEGHIINLPELKTTYVDTHCHLFTTLQMLKDSSQDETIPRDAINTFVETVFPKQIVACVDIHCDLPLSDYHERAIAFDWPEHFKYYFAIGAHPHVANDYTDEVHERIVATMSNPSCVAWGECGLDYFKNPPSTHETQLAVFKRQLAAAVALNKPIIVHTRNADTDTLACIREIVPRDHHMHIHCFTAGGSLARAILCGYPNSFIGLTGVISYAGTEHVAELVTSGELPLDRILLESDSPYMVPKLAYGWLSREKPELRKKRFVVSHGGMIPFTAEILTGLVNQWRAACGEANVKLEEVLDVTRRNAAKMYGIDV